MPRDGESNHSRFDYERDDDGRKILLGRGNFVTVFAALDLKHGNAKIAVKEVCHIKNVEECVDEIKRHCHLSHKNIVRYVECLHSGDTIKIFMERIAGGNLADLLRLEWGPLPPSEPELKSLTKQMIDGLVYLHQQRIIHGNLRPRNILINTLTQTLKLSNFGLYLAVRDDLQTGVSDRDVYIAPEVVDRKEVTQSGDVWSAGCVVIAMITGSPPERQTVPESVAAFRVERRCDLFIPANLPRDIHSFVQRCVNKDHKRRPSAQELSEDSFLIQPPRIRSVIHTYEDPHDVLMDRPQFIPVEGHLPYNGQNFIYIDKSLTLQKGRMTPCNNNTPQRIMQQLIPQVATSEENMELLVEYSKFENNNYVKGQALRTILYILERRITTCHLNNNTDFLTLEKELLNEKGDDSSTVEEYRLKTYVMVIAILYIRRIFASSEEPTFEITEEENPTMIKCVLKKLEAIKKKNRSNYTWRLLYKFLKKLQSRFNPNSKRQKTKQLFVSFLQFGEAAREYVSQEDIKVTEKQVMKHFQGMRWLERHILLHYVVSKICLPEVSENSCRNQLIELFQRIVRQISVNIPEYALSVLHAYVKLLCRFSSAEGSDLVFQDNPQRKGMGFKRFLESSINCLDHKIFSEVLSPLCFHPYSDVYSAVIDFSVPKKLSKKKLAGGIKRLIQCQCKYIAQILEPFQFQHKVEFVDCQQSDCDKSQYHDICTGTFGKDTDIQIYIARHKLPQDGDILRNEIAILRELSTDQPNPNVIQLLAFQNQLDPVFYTVASKGMSMSLKVFLVEKVHKIRPRLQLMDLVRHAILPLLKAVRFCHDKNILLRNITSASFVTKQVGTHGSAVVPFTIMLNSFHMAVFSEAKGSPDEESRLIYFGSKQDRIPVLWCAPEVLLECFHTEFSEVYMVGHTVLEILTNGDPPYSEMQHLTEDEKVLEILKHGVRPQQPADIPDSIFSSARECLKHEPKARLSLGQLQGQLEDFLEISTGYEVTVTEKSPNQPMKPLRKYNEMPPFLINARNVADLPNSKVLHKEKCLRDELKAQDDPVFFEDKECHSIHGKHWIVLKELKHRNVATVSSIIDINKSPHLVTMLKAGTKLDLLKHVLNSQRDEIMVDDLISYICQIAEGMEYLHSVNLLHCCLQAKFVYLSADKTKVEIGHLGRTTLVEHSASECGAQSAKVTPFLRTSPEKLYNMTRYSPREVNENGCYSMRSDVASFGYLIYEVFEARSFHPKTQHVKVVPYAHAKREEVLMEQRRRYKLQQPADCPDWLWENIVKNCIHEVLSLRRLFPKICRMLRERQDVGSQDDHYLILPDFSEDYSASNTTDSDYETLHDF